MSDEEKRTHARDFIEWVVFEYHPLLTIPVKWISLYDRSQKTTYEVYNEFLEETEKTKI
jgi:hypothetical protein